MKSRTSLRRGMKQLRRGLQEALQQAGSSPSGQINVAARRNIVITQNSREPGSHVEASSAQYAPIVQRGRGARPNGSHEQEGHP